MLNEISCYNSFVLKCFMLLVALSFSSVESFRYSSKRPLLLLISFDGFRWDYLNTYNLTNFNELKQNGAHADYIINTFSTVTFPNHWTIVTGLYEESHGIVQNQMYDPILNKTFTYTMPEVQTIEWFGQNKLAEPIWTTNQRAGDGRRSAAEWVGANVQFNGQKIINIPYNKSTPYKDLIDTFIKLYTDEHDPINFGALYFDEPDHTGHIYGPDSQEMRNKLIELDKHLGYLIDQLKASRLFENLNIIITSDHGMQSILNKEPIILDKYVNSSLFEAYGTSTTLNIFLKNGADLENIYLKFKNISNLDVYKKQEIPESLFYKHNDRIGEIVIVSKLGSVVFKSEFPYTNSKFKPVSLKADSSLFNKESLFLHQDGTHGWYNNISSMYPLFIAHGPSFKKKFKIETKIKNVDIYPLMCKLLGIEPGVNNGSLENIQSILVSIDFKYNSVYVFVSLAPVCFASLMALFLFLINQRMNLPGQTTQHTDGYSMLATSELNLVLDDDENELSLS